MNFQQDVPPDSTGTYTTSFIFEIIKSNITTYQSSDLGPDDEERLYRRFGQLERQDFKLDVLYEEPSLGEKRYLPPADVTDPYKGQP